ncbi:hypothetical protein VIGAN_03234700 [Vigna angularis var. angularis]|uniref:Uncharacterized protein n=1 Tax=Vigna angularis var. angularis TaxID=157739 RepID=A0A0S3RP09_PHAAN|nr:hypothetical protein VIGAN_03234700 [Vigna angularis var. angularis]
MQHPSNQLSKNQEAVPPLLMIVTLQVLPWSEQVVHIVSATSLYQQTQSRFKTSPPKRRSLFYYSFLSMWVHVQECCHVTEDQH